MAFSFSFSGDDIDIQDDEPSHPTLPPQTTASAASTAPSASAFPVQGKPQLPPTPHPLPHLLSLLPSKIAYSTLDITLDDGSTVSIPRRELWDVRVQLMAEDDGDDGHGGEGNGTEKGNNGGVVDGLGNLDVKTGVYEGGFKSWESSVDLVKTLAAQNDLASAQPGTTVRVIELGCGTALPTLAMFLWVLSTPAESRPPQTSLVVADYNPTVLQLVTLPNFILAWALCCRESEPALQDAFEEEGELELSAAVLDAFQRTLTDRHIDLTFLSGGWSDDFISLLYQTPSLAAAAPSSPPLTLLLGAETIYSPFALHAFAETTFAILRREEKVPSSKTVAYIAAKRLYFGVGGSLDDFIDQARQKGGVITELREEAEGVRRGVVQCILSGSAESTA